MLPNSRLVQQLANATDRFMYGDDGFLIKSVTSGSFDTYGKPIASEAHIPLSCSFTDKPSREVWKDHIELEVIEGEVRFNSQSEPGKGDRFKIIGRFGSLNYPNKTYEIIGIHSRGDFGYLCALKAVNT